MGAIIGFILLVAISVAVAVGAHHLRDRTDDDDVVLARRFLMGGSALFALGAVLLILFSSIVQVSTRNIGIVTAFGRTKGHLSNGLHLIAPWESVTEMDAAVQTESHTGRDGCVTVRIALQQTACAWVTIRWRIRTDAADSLFQNYRTFEHVRDSLVTRELGNALNIALANYNPLDSVTSAHPTALPDLAVSVRSVLRHAIGGNIDVLSIYLPYLGFDTETQSKINQLQQQVAQTRISTQQILTNEAQSRANAALATSVNRSPNVLVSECLSILTNMVKQGQPVPVGFSCWPGSSTLGGVIVNGNNGSTNGGK